MKQGRILITIGLVLVAAAIGLTGYNLWDDHRAGEVSEALLEQLEPLIGEDPVPAQERIRKDASGTEEIEYPDYILNPGMDMPTVLVDGREYVGTLTIPAIDRKFPVFDQWDYENLKMAPCRYSGSSYLDTMVICAHNYNIHFGYLNRLRYGDEVQFKDMDGNVFNYIVSEIITLEPTAIEEMTGGDGDLTLFTCTLGGATRVTVRCERVKDTAKLS